MKNEQNMKDFALIILLIVCIMSISVSLYAIFNIKGVQNRCDEYYYNKMVEINCIENHSLQGEYGSVYNTISTEQFIEEEFINEMGSKNNNTTK